MFSLWFFECRGARSMYVANVTWPKFTQSSYQNVSTVRKCSAGFVLTRTQEKNMEGIETFSIDLLLEVIGLFDFLTGFCPVEFTAFLTTLNTGGPSSVCDCCV